MSNPPTMLIRASSCSCRWLANPPTVHLCWGDPRYMSSILGVDAPGVVGAVARGAEAERHHGDDLVGVVDQHRSLRVSEAGSAPASDLARVVQSVQITALRDVAVDLHDARARLVPRLHVHGLRLN